MKKILFLIPIFLLPAISTYAATEQDKQAASFLSQKGIIATSYDYKLESTITRREMLKVMMNLSGKAISQTCTGKFKDLPSSDWGCKYAEAALAYGYISANTNFRPNDSVTNIEALKMIMQARGIPKATKYSMCMEENCAITDWKDGYIEGQREYNLIDIGGEFSQVNTPNYFVESDLALRSRVFTMASRTYDTYKNEISHWQEYENSDFSVLIPEYWVYEKYTEENIVFGRMDSFQGGFEFGIEKIDSDFETMVSKIGNQFSDRKVQYKDIQTNYGLKGKMAIITTSEYSDWISKTVFFETKDGNFALSNGATDNSYFENFYKSFQLK